ncbi:MAG: hypothetical protein V3S69_05325 [Dehalococcoidales bacterium]
MDWANAVPFALVIPMGYLFLLLRTTMAELATLRGTTYTKTEADKMTKLYIDPVSIAVKSIKEDVTWIRRALETKSIG